MRGAIFSPDKVVGLTKSRWLFDVTLILLQAWKYRIESSGVSTTRAQVWIVFMQPWIQWKFPFISEYYPLGIARGQLVSVIILPFSCMMDCVPVVYVTRFAACIAITSLPHGHAAAHEHAWVILKVLWLALYFNIMEHEYNDMVVLTSNIIARGICLDS